VDTGGVDGADAVVQALTDRSDSDTSMLVTLSAFGDAKNATVGCFSVVGANTWTEGTGFTDVAQLSGDLSSQMEFRLDNDTTVDATISGSASTIAGIALELKFAEPPATGGGAHGRLGFAF